jgi:ABC-type transport system involved in multi-copper enzyme maturation permease subunit
MTLAVPYPVRKEFSALWVPWLACLAVMAGCALEGGMWSRLVMPIYFLGAMALGALSMGHEYSHRTLTLLLSQPVRRGRVFAQKQGVLAALLLTLFIAAIFVMSYATGRPVTGHSSQRTAALVLPVAYGLLLAPCLTMLCRSAIAGTVFSLAIPGLLFTAGELVAATKYGGHSQAEHLSMAVVWGSALGLCAIGGVMSWWTFMRLEATEGHGTEIRLPRWLRLSRAVSASPGLTRHHPVWLLVKKELRLQQMTLAISGLYVAGWAGVVAMRYLNPHIGLDFFNVLIVFYSGLIALLIGSLACADERQMRTLECQVLLPMATWKQWIVKVAVVLGLSIILALGLPQLLTGGMAWLPSDVQHGPLAWALRALPVVVLTIGSLYVSSLCTSGLWALLMSLPAMLGTVLFVRALAERSQWAIVLSSPPTVSVLGYGLIKPSKIVALGLLLTIGLLAIVLRFGFANYRSADRAPGRVAWQVSWIAAYLAVGQALLSLAVALHMAGLAAGRL